jgi:hypothetical protein
MALSADRNGARGHMLQRRHEPWLRSLVVSDLVAAHLAICVLEPVGDDRAGSESTDEVNPCPSKSGRRPNEGRDPKIGKPLPPLKKNGPGINVGNAEHYVAASAACRMMRCT